MFVHLLLCLILFFFHFVFLKQKTAYEMRISVWSSDVGSSDLRNAAIAAGFFVTGLVGDSSALIANGVDNLADTAVYALSLIALSHGRTWKTRAATVSGVMLLIFAVGILIDVGDRKSTRLNSSH